MERRVTAIARIELDAFAHNVRVLCDRVAPVEVMLAVKADAYGHGMLALGPLALASGASSLAVLEVPAALALREHGVEHRLFAWLHASRTDFDAAVEHHIDLGISSLDELERAARAGSPANPAVVHLKIDTGLHRNGALPEQWPALVERARVLAGEGRVRIEGLWSHLADASPSDDADALGQFNTALEIAASLGVTPPLRHIAASSAGWREPGARFDLVRFGIAAYGISPFDDASGTDLGLRTVMTLLTTVTNDPAPRGQRWIAAGYGDGVPASAVGAEVAIAGRRALVERVDVDRTLVRDDSSRAGDEAIVFGEPRRGEPSAEEWAAWAGTIGDEIVTGVPARVPREYVSSGTL